MCLCVWGLAGHDEGSCSLDSAAASCSGEGVWLEDTGMQGQHRAAFPPPGELPSPRSRAGWEPAGTAETVGMQALPHLTPVSTCCFLWGFYPAWGLGLASVSVE